MHQVLAMEDQRTLRRIPSAPYDLPSLECLMREIDEFLLRAHKAFTLKIAQWRHHGK
jgi:hypothetical protein